MIPTISLDGDLRVRPVEFYRPDFTYVTTNTGKDLFLSNHLLYIIRDKSGVGKNLGLDDGDCILVNKTIKEKKDGYKLYLIEKYPPFSALKGVDIIDKSKITKDTRIIGAVVSKIQSNYFQKYRTRAN